MDESVEALRLKVTQALARLDEGRREARAARVEWLALHEFRPSVVMGRTEAMQLLREAREVFIDGHFVSTLLIALAFIEHTLVEELQLLGHITGSPMFSDAIQTARDKHTFPADWLDRAKALSLRRNPFAHLKPGAHVHSLGNRMRSEQRHASSILEDDAKDAMDLMYNFFQATLREID